MKWKWAALGACLAGVILSTGAHADVFGYAVDTNENLYSVDLTSATPSLIGNMGQFLEGLALSPGGQLFGTDSSGNLFSIDKTTGAASLIGNTGLGDIEGLDFNGSTLVGSNYTNPTTLYSIDTSTASPTAITTTNPGEGVVRALAIQDSTHALLVSDSPAFQSLLQTDLTNGNTVVEGTLPSFMAALDFASDGNLYALDAGGNEYLLNPMTAGGTLIGNTGGQFWLDMTAAPAAATPEPGSVALLMGMSLTGAGFLIKRRRR